MKIERSGSLALCSILLFYAAVNIIEHEFILLLVIIGLAFLLTVLFFTLKWLFSSDKDSKNKRNITGQLNEGQNEQNQ